MKYKIKNIFLLLFFSLLQPACLKDSIETPVTVDISNTESLLTYLESQGDYINSPDMPSIIDASEVFTNINDYLIIDIRTKDEFVGGHIIGAVNISHDKIIDFLDTSNITGYQRIVIVSSTGQSAAFYNSFLRLYGFDNTFSLCFGMASWNQDFADIWNNACFDAPGITSNFTTDENPKNDYSDLPDINFQDSEPSIGNKAKKRIVDLMKYPFKDSVSVTLFSSEYYIVCFASKALYISKSSGIAHPENAVNFIPPPINPDLRSVSNLQTLPNDRTIIFYSYSGQLSSYAAAYLRLLGYNVKTLSFGTHSLYYSTMLSVPDFEPYTFTSAKVMNYPYVTGE
jgi:rhodanese-related sulfurtransferase